jgi:Zn-dependent protease/CBS domain-containing protein
MAWSRRIGRLLGIDIYVHFTFLLFLGFIALSGYWGSGSATSALFGLGMTAAVFGIVVLHELGHALAARWYGIPTKDITLLPFGGVARLERMPEKPVQEMVVALAGPAVNVAMAMLLGAFATMHGMLDPERSLTIGGDVVDQLFWINVVLAVFNMLPALPMDGGRVLRALLSMRLGAYRATHLAANLARVMAGLFAVVGILVNPMLLVIAWFVWVGAGQELAFARSGVAGSSPSVFTYMRRRFAVVQPDDPLQLAADYVRGHRQKDFPVVVGGRLIGLLTRAELLSGMSEFGPNVRVFQVMRRVFPTVTAHQSAEQGFALLAGISAVPVLSDGRLVGLLTREDQPAYEFVQPGGEGSRRGRQEPFTSFSAL